MPIFIVYPAKPDVLGHVLEVLGEPRDLEIEVSVKDERFKELLEDEAERFTIRYSCRSRAERVLELYKKYYKSYISLLDGNQAEGGKTISGFRARWYVDGLSAEFDGFELRIDVRENIRKAIELIQIFKKKDDKSVNRPEQ
ncbi:MAG: hypothetical protein ACP5LQ_08430 [Candidatus Methanodesulfokora sp.]